MSSVVSLAMWLVVGWSYYRSTQRWELHDFVLLAFGVVGIIALVADVANRRRR